LEHRAAASARCLFGDAYAAVAIDLGHDDDELRPCDQATKIVALS
jgi:hypothetical protein